MCLPQILETLKTKKKTKTMQNNHFSMNNQHKKQKVEISQTRWQDKNDSYKIFRNHDEIL